jgi:hypothetical protein
LLKSFTPMECWGFGITRVAAIPTVAWSITIMMWKQMIRTLHWKLRPLGWELPLNPRTKLVHSDSELLVQKLMRKHRDAGAFAVSPAVKLSKDGAACSSKIWFHAIVLNILKSTAHPRYFTQGWKSITRRTNAGKLSSSTRRINVS